MMVMRFVLLLLASLTLTFAMEKNKYQEAATPSSSSSSKIDMSSSPSPSADKVVMPSLDPNLVEVLWQNRHNTKRQGALNRKEIDARYHHRKKLLGQSREEKMAKEEYQNQSFRYYEEEEERTTREGEETSQDQDQHQEGKRRPDVDTVYARCKLRKKVLGIGSRDRIPEMYFGLPTMVYLEADKLMKKQASKKEKEEDKKTSILDAIKLGYAIHHQRMRLPMPKGHTLLTAKSSSSLYKNQSLLKTPPRAPRSQRARTATRMGQSWRQQQKEQQHTPPPSPAHTRKEIIDLNIPLPSTHFDLNEPYFPESPTSPHPISE